MLAGRMKLKHFSLIMIAFVLLAGGGLLWWARAWMASRPVYTEPAAAAYTPPPPVNAPPVQVVSAPPPQAVVASDVPGSSVPAYQDAMFSWRGRDLGSDKIKDAVKGKSWKVNFYQDAGKAVMNRAKVDLDRDDKWDEKWTFDGDTITRQVAPADDENYTQTLRWLGGAWVEG